MRFFALGLVACVLAACSSFSEAGGDSGTSPDAAVPPPATDAGGDGGPDAGGADTGQPATPNPYSTAVLSDGPALYYRFDDGAMATEFVDEKMGPPATPQGGSSIVSGASGPISTDPTNYAASIIGNSTSSMSYIDCGDSSRLGSVEQLTIELWVNTTTKGSDQLFVTNVDNTSADAKGFSLSLVSGHLQFSIGDGVSVLTATDSDAFPPNWNHVVVTYDGSGGKAAFSIFVNGAPATLFSLSESIGTLLGQGNELRVGLNTRAPLEPFDGVVDELAIYTHLLDGGKIKHHYLLATNPIAP